MILRIGEREWRGRAIDCPQAVDPHRVATAVGRSAAVEGSPPIGVTCSSPSPVHDHVGCITPDMGLRVKTALARAGRARDLTTPVDDRIARLEDRLSAVAHSDTARRDARRRVAAAGADTDYLRERVAEHRGRLDGGESSAADGERAAALESAAGQLAEAETSAIAARQELERERSAARAVRDRLAERRAIEEELANARRAARSRLVARLIEPYRRALRAVPGTVPPEAPFDADPVSAALAIARVAAPSAPIVLACERFEDADAASAGLRCPVVRLRA